MNPSLAPAKEGNSLTLRGARLPDAQQDPLDIDTNLSMLAQSALPIIALNAMLDVSTLTDFEAVAA